MILESLILLGFIALLAALFHFKIKNIASTKKPVEPLTSRETSRHPEMNRQMPSLSTGSADTGLHDPPSIHKLNEANPKAVATLITHWVESDKPPENKKQPQPYHR